MKKQKETQYERIIKWFDNHETLTRIEAYEQLGIFEAPARICDLKRQGYQFETEIKSKKSSRGYTFNYAVWRLIK